MFPSSSQAPLPAAFLLVAEWGRDGCLLAECALGFGEFSALTLSYFDVFSFSSSGNRKRQLSVEFNFPFVFFLGVGEALVETSSCAGAIVLSSQKGTEEC